MSALLDDSEAKPMLALDADGAGGPPRVIYRHPLAVRLTHWINVLAISFLLLSGLQILRAHPHLYWGAWGFDPKDAWLSFKSIPAWLTIPTYRDLGAGRHWHFFFAWLFAINGLVYLAFTVFSGRLKRVLAPDRDQLTPEAIKADLIHHLKFQTAHSDDAARYNLLQKLAYLGIALVILPVMVLTGLTMSPGFNAVAPWMLDLFGGRQSARSLHFIAAMLIVAFVAVHVFEVFLAGFVNEVRSMITGRYVIPEKKR
ncbi:MAG: cytochrome b/b6 domain-containing protein [Caulobacteraceae bacterium]